MGCVHGTAQHGFVRDSVRLVMLLLTYGRSWQPLLGPAVLHQFEHVRGAVKLQHPMTTVYVCWHLRGRDAVIT